MKKLICLLILLIATDCYAYDTYTKLLSHFDSMYEGGKPPIAATGQKITYVGTAQATRVTQKFGLSSLALDGDSDYVTVPGSSDWTMGTGDWEVDFWLYLNNVGVDGRIFEIGDYNAGGVGCIFDSIGNLMSFYITDATARSWAFDPVKYRWYHIALTKASGTYRFYVDGVKIGTDIANASNITTSSTIEIGVWSTALSSYTNGKIDEFRILKGLTGFPTATNFITPKLNYYGKHTAMTGD